MSSQRFHAAIQKSAARTVIPLPFNPNEAWGVKERHHVSGTIDGHAFRGPLGADGETFYLTLGPAWLRDNHLAPGAAVEVMITPEGPQITQMAADITLALDAEPQAKAYFESLATFYRKNYINWIEEARQPATRAARIEKMLDLLKDGKKAR
jgi:hypothetical protein